MHNTLNKPTLIVKIIAIYCLLVTLFFVGQTLVLGFKVPSEFRADTIFFEVVLTLGILIAPTWWYLPKKLPLLLTLWWLPQLIQVTHNQYLQDGQMKMEPVWSVILLFFSGPNIGTQIAPSMYRLIHLNVFAAIALLILLASMRRRN